MRAVKVVDDGILIDIEVSTGSGRFEIAGYNSWRDRIEIKIKSLPTKGKANKEVINEFSKITKRDVEIISGHKNRLKTLKIYGMSKEEFLNISKIN
jgi:uncharacterized protein (TIGR00251 family)